MCECAENNRKSGDAVKHGGLLPRLQWLLHTTQDILDTHCVCVCVCLCARSCVCVFPVASLFGFADLFLQNISTDTDNRMMMMMMITATVRPTDGK